MVYHSRYRYLPSTGKEYGFQGINCTLLVVVICLYSLWGTSPAHGMAFSQLSIGQIHLDTAAFMAIADESGRQNHVISRHGRTVHSVFFTRGQLSIAGVLGVLLVAGNVLQTVFISWLRSLRDVVRVHLQRTRQNPDHQPVLEELPDLVWVVDLAGRITSINPVCQFYTGVSQQKLLGKKFVSLFHEEDIDILTRALFHDLDKSTKKCGVVVECRLLGQNGLEVPLEIHARVVRDRRERPKFVQGIAIDISARKGVESELLRSEALLNATQEISKVGGWEWDVIGEELFWTRETYRIHGIDPDEGAWSGKALVARSISCYVAADQEKIRDAFLRCIATGQPYDIECRFHSLRGEDLWVRTVGQAVKLDGRIVKVRGNFADITVQKNAQKVMQYQEILLREMGEVAKIGGWEFNPKTGAGTWTDEVARIHDLDPEDQTNKDLGLQFYQGESRSLIEKAVHEAISEGTPYDLELELITRKGVRKLVRTIGRPEILEGKVVRVRGSLQDVTDIRLAVKRIEHLNRILLALRDVKRLVASERNEKRLIEEACHLLVAGRGYVTALITLVDEQGVPHSWFWHGQEVMGKIIDMLQQGRVPPCCEQAGKMVKTIEEKERDAICGDCPASKGHQQTRSICMGLQHEDRLFGFFIAALDGSVEMGAEEEVLFQEMAEDLAQALYVIDLGRRQKEDKLRQESLEAQLLQAQKMESIARLAGGVAHDYNNMLSVILGFSELALDKIGENDAGYEELQEILSAGRKTVDITRQLLAFARKQEIEPRVLDLNETVTSMLKMLRRLIGEDIALKWLPKAGLWPVSIDPSQLDQILANLVVNARDAISVKGEITIETQKVTVDEDMAESKAGLIPGDYIVLAVSDNGCGMDAHTKENLFEPFYTTKSAGKGTGLGLSTVYGIVKQNNGHISIYSEPGLGSTFRIYLSRHHGDLVKNVSKSDLSQLEGHGETLLLVEDEEGILRVTSRMLSSFGYRVLTSISASDALKIATEHEGEISLLITDVIMPGMNGPELELHIREILPDIKVLYISGYTADIIANSGLLKENVMLLQKPFTRVKLGRKVRAALHPDLPL